MSIESKIPTEELNIKDLSLKVPEKSEFLPFEVGRDIKSEGWELIRAYLAEFKQLGLNLSPGILMSIKYLDPSYDLKMTQENWQGIYKELERLKNTGIVIWAGVVQYAAEIKLLDPQFDPHFSIEDWVQIISRLNKSKSSPDHSLVSLAMGIKILKPDYELKLTDKDWEAIKKEFVERDLAPARKKFIKFYAGHPAQIKMLNSDFPLDLTSQDWGNMKEALEFYKTDKNAPDFIHQAFYLKVLSAQEVKITQKGLEIINPATLNTAGGALPEIKKF